ncbi:MAG TPA: DMT family transporter [Dongiaceae bacterium]|nr:DMT family transporter [Dongiaceae bacterium]
MEAQAVLISGTTQARRAIFYMLGGVLCFALYDATGKWLTRGYSPWEILCLSRVVPSLAMVWTLGRQGFVVTAKAWPHHLVRGIAILATASCFFLAAAAIPLAQAVAITFTAPLLIIVLAGPFLGEKVPGRSWLALGVGFSGSIVMIRPGFGDFKAASLFAVASALFYAIAIILLRRLPAMESRRNILAYNTLIMCAGALPGTIILWQRPDVLSLLLMLLMGGLGFLAQSWINEAYLSGPTARIAPLEYMALPYSMALGVVLWHDIPAWSDAAGALLIIIGNVLGARRGVTN